MSMVALGAACFFSFTVPSVLHAFKLDPLVEAARVWLQTTNRQQSHFHDSA